jgi:predicted component of type VI protein secretion system
MKSLVISVLNPAGAPQRAVFGPRGGTIGRADNNTLMLADIDRSVSRLQARVEWRDDAFVLVNMGINPVRHNAHPLSTAEETPLAAGDSLRIGSFALQVDVIEVEVNPAAPPAVHDEDALFDDMTGLPLPREAPTWLPDIALFEDSSSSTGPGAVRLPTSEEALLADLLRGMGCSVPQWPAPLSAQQMQQVGTLMREAMNDTMRQWLTHVSPAAQQAWFSRFDELFQHACRTRLAVPAVDETVLRQRQR